MSVPTSPSSSSSCDYITPKGPDKAPETSILKAKELQHPSSMDRYISTIETTSSNEDVFGSKEDHLKAFHTMRAELIAPFQGLKIPQTVFSNLHDAGIISGTEHEGGRIAHNAKFFLECIEKITAIDPELKNLDFLKNDLEKLQKQDEGYIQAHNEIRLARNSPAIYTIVKTKAMEAYTAINQLKPGESCVIPTGWTGKSTGHATITIFSREDAGHFSMIYIDTGDLSIHAPEAIDAGKLKHSCYIIYEHIPQERLDFNYFYAIAHQKLIIEKDKTESCDHDIVRELELNPLEDCKSDRTYLFDDLTTGQRSGTCAMKAILAFVFLQMRNRGFPPNVYKKWVFLIDYYSLFHYMNEFIDQAPPPPDSPKFDDYLNDQTLIKEAITNLLHMLSKNISKDSFSNPQEPIEYYKALSGMQIFLEEIEANTQVTMMNFKQSHQVISRAASLCENFAPPYQDADPTTSNPTPPITPFSNELDNPSLIIQSAKKCLETAHQLARNGEIEIAKYELIQFANALMIQNQMFWNNVADRAALMKDLVGILDLFASFFQTEDSFCLPHEQNAILSLFAAVRNLYIAEEERLHPLTRTQGERSFANYYNYDLTIEPFASSPLSPFLSPSDFVKREQLTTYFRGTQNVFINTGKCEGLYENPKFSEQECIESLFRANPELDRDSKKYYEDPNKRQLRWGDKAPPSLWRTAELSIDTLTNPNTSFFESINWTHIPLLKKAVRLTTACLKNDCMIPQENFSCRTEFKVTEKSTVENGIYLQIEFNTQSERFDPKTKTHITRNLEKTSSHPTSMVVPNGLFGLRYVKNPKTHIILSCRREDNVKIAQQGVEIFPERYQDPELMRNHKHVGETLALYASNNPTLNKSDLLSHYKDHLDRLEEKEEQNLFLQQFFKAHTTLSHIQKPPMEQLEWDTVSFKEQFLDFIQSGKKQYKSLPTEKKLPMILFLIKVTSLFSIHYQTATNAIDPTFLHRLGIEIGELDTLVKDRSLSPSQLSLIHSARLFHFAICPHNPPEMLPQILESWLYFSTHTIPEEKIERYEQRLIRQFIYRYFTDSKLFPFPREILTDYLEKSLKELNVIPKEQQISVHAAPNQGGFFSITNKEDASPLLTINLLTMQVVLSGGESLSFDIDSEAIHQTAAIRDLFGSQHLNFYKKGPFTYFDIDEGGTKKRFKFESKDLLLKTLQWEIDIPGQGPLWVQFYDKAYLKNQIQHLDNIPTALIADHHLFGCITAQGKRLYFIADEALNIEFQIEDNQVYRIDKTVIESPSIKKLNEFELSEYVLLEKLTTGEEVLTFTRYQQDDGSFLRFRKQQGCNNFVWEKDKRYSLMLTDIPSGLLGRFISFLPLVSNKGDILCLIPDLTYKELKDNRKNLRGGCLLDTDFKETNLLEEWSKPQALTKKVLAIPLKRGSLAPINEEQSLKAAYIMLGQQEYEKAMEFLKSVSFATLAASKQSINLLESIVLAPKLVRDDSIYARTIKLEALFRMLKIGEMQGKERDRNTLILARDCMTQYISEISRVPNPLKLSYMKERYFLKLFHRFEIENPECEARRELLENPTGPFKRRFISHTERIIRASYTCTVQKNYPNATTLLKNIPQQELPRSPEELALLKRLISLPERLKDEKEKNAIALQLGAALVYLQAVQANENQELYKEIKPIIEKLLTLYDLKGSDLSKDDKLSVEQLSYLTTAAHQNWPTFSTTPPPFSPQNTLESPLGPGFTRLYEKPLGVKFPEFILPPEVKVGEQEYLQLDELLSLGNLHPLQGSLTHQQFWKIYEQVILSANDPNLQNRLLFIFKQLYLFSSKKYHSSFFLLFLSYVQKNPNPFPPFDIWQQNAAFPVNIHDWYLGFQKHYQIDPKKMQTFNGNFHPIFYPPRRAPKPFHSENEKLTNQRFAIDPIDLPLKESEASMTLTPDLIPMHDWHILLEEIKHFCTHTLPQQRPNKEIDNGPSPKEFDEAIDRHMAFLDRKRENKNIKHAMAIQMESLKASYETAYVKRLMETIPDLSDARIPPTLASLSEKTKDASKLLEQTKRSLFRLADKLIGGATALLSKIDTSAHNRKEVVLSELIFLFLHREKALYQRLNPALQDDEIQMLLDLTGKYLYASIELDHLKRIEETLQKALQTINVTDHLAISKEIANLAHLGTSYHDYVKDPSLLVFQYNRKDPSQPHHNILFRKDPDQVAAFQHLSRTNDDGTYKPSVAVVPMGGGKTDMLIANLIAARALRKAKPPIPSEASSIKKSIPTVISPSFQYPTVLNKLGGVLKSTFNMDLFGFNYDKANLSTEVLEHIHETQLHILDSPLHGERGAICMTPQCAHFLQLEAECLLYNNALETINQDDFLLFDQTFPPEVFPKKDFRLLTKNIDLLSEEEIVKKNILLRQLEDLNPETKEKIDRLIDLFTSLSEEDLVRLDLLLDILYLFRTYGEAVGDEIQDLDNVNRESNVSLGDAKKIKPEYLDLMKELFTTLSTASVKLPYLLLSEIDPIKYPTLPTRVTVPYDLLHNLNPNLYPQDRTIAHEPTPIELVDLLKLNPDPSILVNDTTLGKLLEKRIYIPDENVQLTLRELINLEILTPIEDLLKLQKNKQKYLSQEVFKQHIAPQLATILATSYKRLGLSGNNPEIKKRRARFARYVSNQMDPNLQKKKGPEDPKTPVNLSDSMDANQMGPYPLESEKRREDMADKEFLDLLEGYANSPDPEVKKTADLIAFTKHILMDVFPNNKEKAGNTSYGRTSNPKNAGEGVPFSAANTEAGTKFAYHFEAAAFQFMLALHYGIQENQLLTLVHRFHENAISFVSTQTVSSYEEAPPAIFFKKYFGCFPYEAKEKLSEFLEEFNANIKAKLKFEAFTIEEFVHYYELRVSANHLCLHDMFHSFVGTGGTIDPFSLPIAMQQDDALLPDPLVNARIIHAALRKAKDNYSVVMPHTDGRDLVQLFNEIILKHPARDQFAAVLDVGATLKDWSQTTSIQAFQRTLQNISPQGKSAFYFTTAHGSKTSDYFAMMRPNDTEPTILENTSKDEFEKYGIELGEFGVLHGQRHCLGIDVKYNPDAVGFVFLDTETSLDDLSQAIMRLRQFLDGQEIVLVVPDHVAKKINSIEPGKTLFDVMRERTVSTREIMMSLFFQAALAQIKRETRDIGKLYQKAIFHVARQKGLDLLQNEAKKRGVSLEEALPRLYQIIKDFSPEFYLKTKDSPYASFGSLSEEIHPLEALQRYADSFRTSLKKELPQDLYNECNLKIEEILKLAKHNKDRFKRRTPVLVNGRGDEMDVIGATMQVEAQAKKEQEIYSDKDLALELASYQFNTTPMVKSYEKLTKSEIGSYLNGFTPKGFTPSPNPLNIGHTPLQEAFSTTSRGDYKKNYGAIFKSGLSASSRFLKPYTENVLLFDRRIPPAKHMLYIEKGNRSYGIILSPSEAASMKRYIRKNPRETEGMWLLMNDRSIIAGDYTAFHDPKTKHLGLDALMLELNIFGGNATYLMRHADQFLQWISQNPENLLTQHHYLKLRAEYDPFSKPFIHKPLLNLMKLTELVQAQKAANNALALSGRNIKSLIGGEIEDVPLNRVHELDPDQIPFITELQAPFIQNTREHVKKLNPAFVSKLHPDYIQNISKEQIPYLTNPAAILQIPLELFDNPNLTPADFGDTVLSNLSATQCNRIHSSSLIERISALKPDQGKYFQPKYTRYLTLESFRANFNFFKQEHFDFLSQEQINLLTPEMVINLKKTNRILLLSFKQLFNALPPETMRSYPINQIECLNYIEKQELFDELPETVIQNIRDVYLLNKLSKKATQKITHPFQVAQFKYLDPTHLKYLSRTQIALIKSHTLDLDRILQPLLHPEIGLDEANPPDPDRFEDLRVDVLNALQNPDTINLLSRDLTRKVTDLSVINKFDKQHLTYLQRRQVASFTPSMASKVYDIIDPNSRAPEDPEVDADVLENLPQSIIITLTQNVILSTLPIQEQNQLREFLNRLSKEGIHHITNPTLFGLLDTRHLNYLSKNQMSRCPDTREMAEQIDRKIGNSPHDHDILHSLPEGIIKKLNSPRALNLLSRDGTRHIDRPEVYVNLDGNHLNYLKKEQIATFGPDMLDRIREIGNLAYRTPEASIDADILEDLPAPIINQLEDSETLNRLPRKAIREITNPALFPLLDNHHLNYLKKEQVGKFQLNMQNRMNTIGAPQYAEPGTPPDFDILDDLPEDIVRSLGVADKDTLNRLSQRGIQQITNSHLFQELDQAHLNMISIDQVALFHRALLPLWDLITKPELVAKMIEITRGDEGNKQIPREKPHPMNEPPQAHRPLDLPLPHPTPLINTHPPQVAESVSAPAPDLLVLPIITSYPPQTDSLLESEIAPSVFLDLPPSPPAERPLTPLPGEKPEPVNQHPQADRPLDPSLPDPTRLIDINTPQVEGSVSAPAPDLLVLPIITPYSPQTDSLLESVPNPPPVSDAPSHSLSDRPLDLPLAEDVAPIRAPKPKKEIRSLKRPPKDRHTHISSHVSSRLKKAPIHPNKLKDKLRSLTFSQLMQLDPVHLKEASCMQKVAYILTSIVSAIISAIILVPTELLYFITCKHRVFEWLHTFTIRSLGRICKISGHCLTCSPKPAPGMKLPALIA